MYRKNSRSVAEAFTRSVVRYKSGSRNQVIETSGTSRGVVSPCGCFVIRSWIFRSREHVVWPRNRIITRLIISESKNRQLSTLTLMIRLGNESTSSSALPRKTNFPSFSMHRVYVHPLLYPHSLIPSRIYVDIVEAHTNASTLPTT